MKAYINDWDYLDDGAENFDVNTFAKKEYPVNEWVTDFSGRRLYLASVYLYDEYVLFFYLGDAADSDFLEGIEYEVNGLKIKRMRGSGCFPMHPEYEEPDDESDEADGENILNGEPDEADGENILKDEYDYLLNLTNETICIPKELENKEIIFYKISASFEKPVEEIHSIAISLETHQHITRKTDKTFAVSYGINDLSVPYTLLDTGEESYIHITELKFHDMTEDFNKNIDRFKELYKEAERKAEQGEETSEKQELISFEQMEEMYNHVLLKMTFSCPQEKRSFGFKADTGYKQCSGGIFFAFFGKGERLPDGLYQHMHSLGKVTGEPRFSYEITLHSVTDSFEIEKTYLINKNYG